MVENMFTTWKCRGEGCAEETPCTVTHRNATEGGEGTVRVVGGKVQEAERHGRAWGLRGVNQR